MTRIVFVFFATLAISGTAYGQNVRSIDGSFNNVFNPDWGSEGHELSVYSSMSFSDGISAVSGTNRKNPRYISNKMFAQNTPIFDGHNLSDFVWAFGQFIDHDIVLVENDPTQTLRIGIPEDDSVFDPSSPGILMFRSVGVKGTGTSPSNPRKYFNAVTAFIDGSGVYGSDANRARWLRTFKDGKLKTSAGNLLPWNTMSGEFNDRKDPNAPFMDDPIGLSSKLFVAGDARANENPILIAMHTIFVREHNRLCDEAKAKHPDWNDEQLYQEARLWLSSYIQSITYNEFLPSIGIHLPKYNGYREAVNPQISNEFSAAAYRMGHTLISSTLLRYDEEGKELASGHISLRDAFFNPLVINLAGGIEPYIRGIATQVQQNMDCKVVDDLRNFLFGSPKNGGLDLAAININRGRERGLPDFNSLREQIGLARLKSFSEITTDQKIVKHLEELYGSIDDIDPWVGMLAENHMPESMVGRTILTILMRQFQSLRDGDRFYFETDPRLSSVDRAKIKQTKFRDVIMRNTQISIMQENVFEAMPQSELPLGPDLAAGNLSATAYPNPTNGEFVVKVHSDEDTEVNISMYDALGRRINTLTKDLHAGDNFVSFNLDDQIIPESLIHLVIKKDKFTSTLIRVVKQSR